LSLLMISFHDTAGQRKYIRCELHFESEVITFQVFHL
jgi:hypothetical protein